MSQQRELSGGKRDEPTVRIRLVREDAHGEGEIVEISGSPFTIGRNEGNDLCLPDSAVSQQHALIVLRSLRVFLKDLKSTNGTMLNDRLFVDETVELRDGDRVEWTPFLFRVQIEEPKRTRLRSLASPSAALDEVQLSVVAPGLPGTPGPAPSAPAVTVEAGSGSEQSGPAESSSDEAPSVAARLIPGGAIEAAISQIPDLVIHLQPFQGQRHRRSLPITIDRFPFVIGRDEACDLSIADSAVSTRHASIELRHGRPYVQDLGSTNGTLLNDDMLFGHMAELRTGDRLEITPEVFEVSVAGSSSSGTSRMRAQPSPNSSGAVAETDFVLSSDSMRAIKAKGPGSSETEINAGEPASVMTGTLDVRLVALEAMPVGTIVRVDQIPFVIGRASGSHLVLADSAVSNRHAALTVEDGKLIVQDLGSTNGTLVNEKILFGEKRELREGDRLEITPARFAVAIAVTGAGGIELTSSQTGEVSPLAQTIGVEQASVGSGIFLPDPDLRESQFELSVGSDALLDAMQNRSGDTRPQFSISASPTAAKGGAGLIDEAVFACPSCGVEGRAPLSRLNRSMQCPQCKAVFRVDSTGKPTLEKAAPTSLVDRLSVPSSLPDIEMGPLPLPGRRLLLALMAVGGIGGLIALIVYLFSGPPPIPDSLTDRAVYVAEAFLDKDYRRILPLILPGTEEDADVWFKLARPEGWTLRIDRAGQPDATPVDVDPPAKQFNCNKIMLKFTMKRGQTEDHRLFMPLYFRETPDGQWLLHGTATRQGTASARRDLPPPPSR